MLNESGETEHLSFSSWVAFSFSPEYDMSYGFVAYDHYYVEVHSLYIEFLFIKWMLSLEAFLHLLR